MTRHFDAAIIGAGQAGPALAARLTASGRSVAFAERHLFGGTCVNTGCTPTKALIASAKAARMIARASDYGLTLDAPARIDWAALMARKDRIVAASRDGVDRWLANMQGCTVYRGHAHLVGPHGISVGGEEIEADNIYLNVGCRAAVPALPGLAKVPYLTNSSILALEEIPEHLLIIGGSYVALEFAQMFRRFGAKVTIIEKSDRLVSREDPDTSHCIEDILRAEGILIKTGAACIGIDGVPGNITAHLNGTEKVSGSHLLLAVGRVPNTADLGLDVAGVMTDERGFIQVDDCLRTSVPHIWAMGDCNGKGAFTHTSYNDYEIIAANVLDRESRKLSDRITAYAIYIDPPMGRAGLTEAQAKATGRRIASGMRPMSRVSRAVEKGEEQGFMRITVDLDSSEILGAVIIGPGADEAIHSVLDMMAARAPWQSLQHVMHIHPTVSELLPTILGELKPVT